MSCPNNGSHRPFRKVCIMKPAHSRGSFHRDRSERQQRHPTARRRRRGGVPPLSCSRRGSHGRLLRNGGRRSLVTSVYNSNTRNEVVRGESLKRGVKPLFLHGTADSQFAHEHHKIVHFSVHRCFADFQVLLHADASKEGHDHLGEYGWLHRGLLGFNIFHDLIFEKRSAL